MPKAPYRVTFTDGSSETIEADNASQAKLDAQSKRIRDVFPAGTESPADRKVHSRVKVSRVEEIIRAVAGAVGDTLRRDQRSRDTESDAERRDRLDREDRERRDRERDERDRGGQV